MPRVSDPDLLFVLDARKRWSSLVDKTEHMDGTTAALALSLWASINVDRLLDIAEGKVS